MTSATILSDNGVTSGSAGLKSGGGNDGTLLLQTTTSGGTATTAVTVDNLQNVGVGVTPSAWTTFTALQVKNAAVMGLNTEAHFSGNMYYNAGYKYISNGFAARYSMNDVAGGAHAWFTAPSGTAGNAITFTQAMTLDVSGNLLVKKTSLTNTGRGCYIRPDAGNGGGFCATGDGTTSFNAFILTEESAGATRFYVQGNGDVKNTNNSYGAISDAKLKENITDATPKLAQLNQVRIVNYNFIGDDKKQLGVVAQELEQVFPAMVDDTPDFDAEGNLLETTTKSVKYSVFVPMLIKAIQEQQSLIQSLTDRLTALEGAAK